ncbi:HAD family hydrolase [Mitsuokella multacida]|nr:HAD family hydrolase [Mitsuokella multacida]
MIKAIFSDMDGTLLNEAGRLPTGFGELAAQLRSRGVIFAPASGRQYASLARTFASYREDFLFIAENGALVRYREKTIFSCPIDENLVWDVLDAVLGKPDIFPVLCGLRHAYVLRQQARDSLLQGIEPYYPNHVLVHSFADVEDVCVKIALFDDSGQAGQHILPYVKTFSSKLQLVESSGFWLDIMQKGVNKGKAIKAVCSRFGWQSGECAAFGDWLNDVEMMKAVRYSFAMANAHSSVKQAAHFTTLTNKENGVLLGIQGLIQKGLLYSPGQHGDLSPDCLPA